MWHYYMFVLVSVHTPDVRIWISQLVTTILSRCISMHVKTNARVYDICPYMSVYLLECPSWCGSLEKSPWDFLGSNWFQWISGIAFSNHSPQSASTSCEGTQKDQDQEPLWGSSGAPGLLLRSILGSIRCSVLIFRAEKVLGKQCSKLFALIGPWGHNGSKTCEAIDIQWLVSRSCPRQCWNQFPQDFLHFCISLSGFQMLILQHLNALIVFQNDPRTFL